MKEEAMTSARDKKAVQQLLNEAKDYSRLDNNPQTSQVGPPLPPLSNTETSPGAKVPSLLHNNPQTSQVGPPLPPLSNNHLPRTPLEVVSTGDRPSVLELRRHKRSSGGIEPTGSAVSDPY